WARAAHSRTPPPAISSFGGFRTPAPAAELAPPPVTGRHPKTFTKADIRRGIGTTGCTALQRERDMCAVQCPRNIAFTARLWLVEYLAAFRVFQYGRTRDIDRGLVRALRRGSATG